MKTCFLHKNPQSSDLILFVSGFASHFSHFSHLKAQNNVLMIYDYKDMNLDIELNSFKNVHLIAFSMGVSISSKLLSYIKFKTSLAINGTPRGIDDEYGIKEEVFKQSMENFNLLEFKRHLFAKNLNLSENFYFQGQTQLKDELKSLFNFHKKHKVKKDLSFDKILLSKRDLIFSNRACENFFKQKNTKIIHSKEPHFVFFAFDSWEELCNI